MSDEPAFTIDVCSGVADVSAAEWDACACPEAADGRAIDPFTTHRFLSAVEESGSATPQTGWAPRHLIARMEGKIVGVMPLYAKGHSQGEYVFDHAWADALQRAGGHYYPKLQICAPFTSASGPRILTKDDKYAPYLLKGAEMVCEQNCSAGVDGSAGLGLKLAKKQNSISKPRGGWRLTPLITNPRIKVPEAEGPKILRPLGGRGKPNGLKNGPSACPKLNPLPG